MVSFATKKVSSFVRPYLVIVVHRICIISVLVRKSFPVPMNSRTLLTFYSIGVSVSGLTLMSLIYLELSFVQGDEYRSIWILLPAAIHFSLHHLLQIHLFSSVPFWLLKKKTTGVHRFVSFFMGLQFNQCFWFCANIMLGFFYYSFVVQFKIGYILLYLGKMDCKYLLGLFVL